MCAFSSRRAKIGSTARVLTAEMLASTTMPTRFSMSPLAISFNHAHPVGVPVALTYSAAESPQYFGT